MLLHSRVLIWLFCCASIAAAHSPLLPKPQQIQYGPGRLPLRDLQIRLAGNVADEDRFAASELAAILSARCKTPILVAENPDGPGPSIVLKRTGPVASLPLPGDRPGPDSREAYRLKIAPAGGEIEATSSAGLYYAVQTLRQLVEGDGAALPEVEIHDWPSLLALGGSAEALGSKGMNRARMCFGVYWMPASKPKGEFWIDLQWRLGKPAAAPLRQEQIYVGHGCKQSPRGTGCQPVQDNVARQAPTAR